MVNWKHIRELEADKLVTVREHSSGELFIVNYTNKAQFSGKDSWTPLLKQCRGLILDKEGDIISRPFEKFFNLEEHENEEIPQESFEVFDKWDGSLGISYYFDGQWGLATRGSFESEQAAQGSLMLDDMIDEVWPKLNPMDPNCTYLFEIIYPENRIVVDYKKERRLVLLSVIDTDTGNELSYDKIKSFGFPDVAKRYPDYINLNKILKPEGENNKEGYVIRFQSGMRVKLKYPEYFRLHRLMSGLSNVGVWEMCRDSEDLYNIIHSLPDDIALWVDFTARKLYKQYYHDYEWHLIEVSTWRTAYSFPGKSRKEFAEQVKRMEDRCIPALMFALYDNKPVSKIIWSHIKPKHEAINS